MKRQFVTYEIALKLKELGFDERCLGYFDIQSKELWLNDLGKNIINLPEILLPAPLWQQAIDWLYTKHNIIIDPVFDDNTWCAHIGKFTIPDVTYDISIQLEEKESFKDSKNAIYELREKAILCSFELIQF